MCYYICTCFIWQSWKIIIGGICLGIAIYSYFYRVNLIFKRQKEIQNIKQILDSMAKLSDKTKDELMHEALEYKIYRISNDMKTANRVLMLKIDTEFGMLNSRFNGFEDKLDSVVGRVKVLENDTEFIRASKKWKWVVGLALLGLISTVNYEVIKGLIKKILPW